MPSTREELDSNGHILGCPLFGEVPMADPEGTHIDLFCDCHTWLEPLVLANGTDVAWPAGWDETLALAWRAKHGLAVPV